MDEKEVLAFLLKHAATIGLGLAKNTIDVVIDSAIASARKRRDEASAVAFDEVRKLVLEEHGNRGLLGWLKLHASSRDATRGIALIGPSGSGKTATSKHLGGPSTDGPTTGEERRLAGLGDKLYVVRDTAGAVGHRLEDGIDALVRNPPRVLCFVFADGHLKTQLDADFHREGHVFETVEEYVENARREELAWTKRLHSILRKKITRPRQRVDDVVVLASKMDLWWHESERVMESYTNGPLTDEVNAITEFLCGPGQHPMLIPVAARHESFLGKHTAPRFNPDLVGQSQRFLWATLTALLCTYES